MRMCQISSSSSLINSLSRATIQSIIEGANYIYSLMRPRASWSSFFLKELVLHFWHEFIVFKI